jgi:hypothetical protein
VPNDIRCLYFNIRNTTRLIRIKDLGIQYFLFYASLCNPELNASENSIRVNDLRTVGKVMAE